MELNKKKRMVLITFLLNGVLFLLGGLALIADGKFVLGGIQLLAGIPNLVYVMLRNAAQKTKLEIVTLIFNILVASTVALDYFLGGRNYLQYAWLLAAIFSCIALMVLLRRNKMAVAYRKESDQN